MIWLDFYLNQSWCAVFVVGCFVGSVTWGHDMGKWMHDFLNIVHLKRYQSRQHSYAVPRALRWILAVALLVI
jgi:hypothetical protein